MMRETTVEVKGLVKKYGSFTAVNGIDLDIRRGEIFGLLGANGAGKTTTLECLEGLRRANGGRVRVAGCDPREDERKLRHRLGVQLQSSSLPESIRVDEAVALICAWQKVPVPAELIGRFRVGGLLKKQYRQLSTGQKRRVHLVLAMVSRPEVLVLDEPTAGLDVQSRAELHEEIRAIREKGVTVLLATHDMAEAEALCDRIAILLHGKIAVIGTPEQITAAGRRETRIRLRTAHGALRAGGDVREAAFAGEKDGTLEWRSRNVAASLIEILGRVQAAEDTVEDLRVERPSLEERFLELTEGAAV
jgi:ABC-2 type transport system ATP-binding protein